LSSCRVVKMLRCQVDELLMKCSMNDYDVYDDIYDVMIKMIYDVYDYLLW
jgi:hypothetical protein